MQEPTIQGNKAKVAIRIESWSPGFIMYQGPQRVSDETDWRLEGIILDNCTCFTPHSPTTLRKVPWENLDIIYRCNLIESNNVLHASVVWSRNLRANKVSSVWARVFLIQPMGLDSVKWRPKKFGWWIASIRDGPCSTANFALRNHIAVQWLDQVDVIDPGCRRGQHHTGTTVYKSWW